MYGHDDLKIDQNILVNGNSPFSGKESTQLFSLSDFEKKLDKFKNNQGYGEVQIDKDTKKCKIVWTNKLIK